MKKIILIACAAKKQDRMARAEDLYVSSLFKYSMAYARQLQPDRIYILSALYGLLETHQEIDPYDVTLSNIPSAKRRPGLKVLTSAEKRQWANEVMAQLTAVADLNHDEFVFLAGKEYTQLITRYVTNFIDPMQGLRQGQRLTFLKMAISQ